MQIKKAEYVLTAVKPEQYPVHEKPEIAVVGRSNVGKSTFINRIANQKHLAKTSGKPGKTRTINFYIFNDEFYLVDLPGYGYANVPKSMKTEWANMVDGYLRTRFNLIAVVLLIDMRHRPTREDRQMYGWLKDNGIHTLIACTKADKISKSRWRRHMDTIRETLNVLERDEVVPVSGAEPGGADQALDIMGKILYGNAII